MHEYENDDRVFRFRFGGKEYEIPAYGTLPAEYVEDLLDCDDAQKQNIKVVSALLKVLPEELKSKLNQRTLGDIANDWTRDAGVKPGELHTSSD